jgi:tRNA threonylcarbamoyladenosine biosynthesis protein TsaE
MELVYRIDDIDAAARKVWDKVNGRQVMAFSGEMGAGKTTFINAFCRQLGVEGTTSPTFSIINEYQSSRGTIYHIDLYRCRSEEEVIRAGVEECLYSGNICLVEWPSRAEGIFPSDTIRVSINEVDELTRKITIE